MVKGVGDPSVKPLKELPSGVIVDVKTGCATLKNLFDLSSFSPNMSFAISSFS